MGENPQVQSSRGFCTMKLCYLLCLINCEREKDSDFFFDLITIASFFFLSQTITTRFYILHREKKNINWGFSKLKTWNCTTCFHRTESDL